MTMKCMKISVEGVGATTSGTSARSAIPNDSTGNKAKYVLVCSGGTVFFLPGNSSVDATNSSPVVGADSPVLLDVSGHSHIAYLEGTTAARITITPVEF